MDVLKSYFEISPFFFILTASASLLYMTMNLFMVFGGDNTGEHVPSDLSFKFFSTQTILAFFMGFGWAGITASVKWKFSFLAALPIATVFGIILMSFSAFLLYHVQKLNHVPVANIYSALGNKGSVYAQIPGDGPGKVQIIVSGSLKIVSAVSAEGAIDSFTEVEVVGVKDQDTIIVKRISTATPNGEKV